MWQQKGDKREKGEEDRRVPDLLIHRPTTPHQEPGYGGQHTCMMAASSLPQQAGPRGRRVNKKMKEGCRRVKSKKRWEDQTVTGEQRRGIAEWRREEKEKGKTALAEASVVGLWHSDTLSDMQGKANRLSCLKNRLVENHSDVNTHLLPSSVVTWGF